MPSMHEVTSLEQQTINIIAKTLLKALVSIEWKKEREKKHGHKKDEEISDTDELSEWLDLPTDLIVNVMKTFLQKFADSHKDCPQISLIDQDWGNIDNKDEDKPMKICGNDFTQEQLEEMTDDPLMKQLMSKLREVANNRTPKLANALQIFCRKSSIHVDVTDLMKLGTLSPATFTHFHQILNYLIPKMENLQNLNLSNVNNKTCLPQINNQHIQLIGQHCTNLEILNISYHKNITRDGILYLGKKDVTNESTESAEEQQEFKTGDCDNQAATSGCYKLQELFIFDTGVFEKDVAKLVGQLPELRYLGYKETGKVIKTLNKSELASKLKLTHVDNRGSKARRMDYSSLRCKKAMLEAVLNLCPDVVNLKLRVADDDVEGLAQLVNVVSLELVYHVGSVQTPGLGTQRFLQARGRYLTSLAILCQNLTAVNIKCIAENCVNMEQLWLRSNHYMPTSQDDFDVNHNFLQHLHTLYIRIGSNELYVVQNLPPGLIPYLIRNGPLRELIVGIRSNQINNTLMCNMLCRPNLAEIEKILIMIPGTNSIQGTLTNLTEFSVDFILNNCRYINKLGNLLSWNLKDEYKIELYEKIKEQRWNLQVIDRKMTLR